MEAAYAPPAYGALPEGYTYPAAPAYGAPPGYAPPPGYGVPPEGYSYPAAHAYGYGAPPPAYGYGAPPPAYGAPPDPYGYGAPPPGYGAPPAPGYGAPPAPGYGAPASPYGAAPGAPAPGYGAMHSTSPAGGESSARSSSNRPQQRRQTPGRIEAGEKTGKSGGGKAGGKSGKSDNKGKGKSDKGKGKASGKDGKDGKGRQNTSNAGSEEKGAPIQDDSKGGKGTKGEKGEKGGKGGKGGKGKKGEGHMMMGKGGGGKGKGKVAMKIAWGEPCFVGRLRNYNSERKAGTISCAEAYNLCGMETYAYGSVLEPANVGVGDTLVFFIHWSNWGQPQASYELLRISAVSGHALKGTFKRAGDAESEKDFGFIDCADAKEYFGRDIYVNKEFAAGLQTGQWVSFNVKLNRDMMPNVTEIEACEESWTPTPGDLSQTKEAEDVPPSWEGSAIHGLGPSSSRRSSTPKATGEFFTAEFKTFNEANGWGFVGSDELKARFGADVFAHNRELMNVPVKAVGEVIYFELGMTEDGKPQVLNATPAGASAEPPAKKQKLDDTPGAEAGATAGAVAGAGGGEAIAEAGGEAAAPAA